MTQKIEGENVHVHFSTGYTGQVVSKVKINDKEHILEIPYLTALLEKMIEERGYTVEQSKRQKYPRIIINE